MYFLMLQYIPLNIYLFTGEWNKKTWKKEWITTRISTSQVVGRASRSLVGELWSDDPPVIMSQVHHIREPSFTTSENPGEPWFNYQGTLVLSMCGVSVEQGSSTLSPDTPSPNPPWTLLIWGDPDRHLVFLSQSTYLAFWFPVLRWTLWNRT